jgi:hypothetical protein
MPRPPSALRRRPTRLRLVSLEDRTVPAFGPDGPEFRVNDATAGAQHLPDVDLNAAGDLVAVWAGFNPDTGGTDVYARRYTPAGQPAGGEFVVNAFTAGTQAEPRVAVDPAGNFVVAWSGAGADDDNGVFARAFRADGTPLGPDFWANTGGAGGFQTSPDVALAADGRFVVVWYGFVPGDNSGFGIGAQRYALVNGTVTPVGENFAANAALTSNEQFAPAVALTDAGNYVVAWQGFAAGTPDTSGYGVYAQRFDFAGPLGGPVWVNKDLADLDQVSPDVDIGPSGAFAVVWQGAAGTGAPDMSG